MYYVYIYKIKHDEPLIIITYRLLDFLDFSLFSSATIILDQCEKYSENTTPTNFFKTIGIDNEI